VGDKCPWAFYFGGQPIEVPEIRFCRHVCLVGGISFVRRHRLGCHILSDPVPNIPIRIAPL
jgi:hypothetical protein